MVRTTGKKKKEGGERFRLGGEGATLSPKECSPPTDVEKKRTHGGGPEKKKVHETRDLNTGHSTGL